MKRVVCIGGGLVALLAAAGMGRTTFVRTVTAQSGTASTAPKLEVDLLWPKPFPVGKHWILSSVTGVTVDGQDHVWVVHRGVDALQANEKGPALEPWASMCCFSAPQVLEFDAAGTLLASWDPKTGSGYDWPASPSGIAVDDKGNVWIGSGLPTPSLPAGRGRGAPAAGAAGAPAGRGGPPAAPPPPADAQVLKFDKAGKFLLQIGKAGKTEGSDSTTGLNRPGRARRRFRGERSLRRRRVRQSPHRRVRRDDRRVQAQLGRVRREADRHRPGRVRSERRGVQAVPHAELREDCEGRHGLRVRSAERSHPGVPEERQVREGRLRLEDHDRRRLGVGRGVLAGRSGCSTSPTVTTRRCGFSTAARSTRSAASATADVTRVTSMASAASPSIRRATCTPAKLTTASACRSS